MSDRTSAESARIDLDVWRRSAAENLRLVVGLRFAAVEAGVSQIVYLVFFTWAHFLEGFTGLIVTIGGILTLFALMQLTGRIRWSEAETSWARPALSAP